MKGVYKYTGIEAAKKILENESFRFSSPRRFNDSMDINPSLINHDFESQHHIGPEQLQDLQELKKKFMLNPSKENEFLISQAYFSMLNNKYNILKISCFSLNGDSEFLWNEYGENGEGVVLTFYPDLHNDVFLDKREYFFSGIVNYVSEYPSIKYQSDLKSEIYSKWIFTKLKKKYSWEEEFRIGYYKNDIQLTKEDYIDIQFDPRFIREIKFGRNIKLESKNSIRELIKAKDWKHVEIVDLQTSKS